MIFYILLTLIAYQSIQAQFQHYQTLTTSNFIIRFEKGISNEDISKLSKTFDTVYYKLQKRLKISLSSRADVYVFSSKARFRSDAKSQLFDDGIFRNGKIFINSQIFFSDEDRLQNGSKRLIALSILDRLKLCPQWLKEAYALYVGEDLVRFSEPTRISLSTFSDLNEEFLRISSAKDEAEVYALLSSTAEFFVERYGGKKFERIFYEFYIGSSFEDAVEKSFGVALSEIEREWVKSIRAKRKRD